MADILAQLAWLEARLPPLPGTDVNERTLYVWRRYWIDGEAIQDIALEAGWSPAAIEFHLRRAAQILDRDSS